MMSELQTMHSKPILVLFYRNESKREMQYQDILAGNITAETEIHEWLLL